MDRGRHHATCLTVFLAIFVVSINYVSGTKENSAGLISKSLTKTSMDLYQLLKKSGENMIFSPISLQMATALAYAGAKGNTAKEIEDAFKLPSRNETLEGHLTLLQQLAAPELKLANKMYVDKSLVLEKTYEEDVIRYFFTKTGKVSFQDSVKAAAEINQWAESQTNNKIKNIMDPGALTPATRLVLLNAIYFKADWKYPFKQRFIAFSKFYVSKDQSIDAEMMYQRNKFSYLHSDQLKAKILAMPYTREKFQMYIILPDEVDGLEQVEENFAKSDLSEILKMLKEDEIDVRVPKFKIESTFKTLAETLAKLGIKDLFTNADLSGISKEPLSVSKVIQKAFVEVNERGTEAAAITAFEVEYLSVEGPPTEYIKFTADHPFMYIIKKEDLIIFQGRFVNPTATN